MCLHSSRGWAVFECLNVSGAPTSFGMLERVAECLEVPGEEDDVAESIAAIDTMGNACACTTAGAVSIRTRKQRSSPYPSCIKLSPATSSLRHRTPRARMLHAGKAVIAPLTHSGHQQATLCEASPQASSPHLPPPLLGTGRSVQDADGAVVASHPQCATANHQ